MYKVETAEAYLTDGMLDMTREDMRYAVVQTKDSVSILLALFHWNADAEKYLEQVRWRLEYA